MFVQLLLSAVVGYLLGSIPFALVIGKVFYKTDIRNFGSKNLGGGNAGRVLGKIPGLAVMTLDILKVALAIGLAALLPAGETAMIIAGLAAAIGHCFPLFTRFKGGKAVATMYGFLFSMMVFRGCSPLIFFLPLVSFLIILYIGKIIALSSIGSSLVATLCVALTTRSPLMTCTLIVFAALIVWRHRANLARILRKEENKITWM